METKICETCKETKAIKYFGVKGQCRKCSRCSKELSYIRKNFALPPKSTKSYFVCQETWRDFKSCIDCKAFKLVSEFHKTVILKSGLQMYNACCKKCRYIRHSSKHEYKKYRPFIDADSKKECKKCPRCKIVKETKIFYKKSGVPSICKECRNRESRELYAALSTEEKKAYVLKKTNRPSAKIYRQKCKDAGKYKETRKRYYEKNKNICGIKRSKKWHSMTSSQRAEYYRKNYQIHRKSKMAYHARKQNAPIVVPFTREEIIKRDGLICYLCDAKLLKSQVIIEHLTPLVRGGAHKPENVKVACHSCNQRKHKKTVTEYKKYRGDYDRFKKSAISSNVYL